MGASCRYAIYVPFSNILERYFLGVFLLAPFFPDFKILGLIAQFFYLMVLYFLIHVYTHACVYILYCIGSCLYLEIAA